jgi:hypothetical protein
MREQIKYFGKLILIVVNNFKNKLKFLNGIYFVLEEDKHKAH